MSNEDWQFEEPLLSVDKAGRVVKSRLAALETVQAKPVKMRPISEVWDKLGKTEVDEVNFKQLPGEKQLKLVADEYNANTPVREMSRKLGINSQRLYELIYEARDKGLIAQLRTEAEKPPEASARETAQLARSPVTPTATVEDILREAEAAKEQVKRYQQRAERLEQAGQIAQAIDELLGERAGHIIAAIYSEVV